MKNILQEFKKFITRGNVVDLAVGVTIGSAFTAITTALTNNILKPIINWVIALILGTNSLSNIYTFLRVATVDVTDEATGVVTTEVDLANSIYIDWGAFISAVINFFLIAIVLFVIVKAFNHLKDHQKQIAGSIKNGKLTKAERREMKEQGLNPLSLDDVNAYREAKAKEAAEKAAAEQAAADKAAQEEAERAAYAAASGERQEALLREIVELLKNK